MRKVYVTFECDEKVLGSLIIDLTEKPNTRIVNIKAIAEVPAHVNGKTNGKTGLTGFEVMEKLSKASPHGFTYNVLQENFEAAGLSRKSVNSFLGQMQKRGIIKRTNQDRPATYKQVRQ